MARDDWYYIVNGRTQERISAEVFHGYDLAVRFMDDNNLDWQVYYIESLEESESQTSRHCDSGYMNDVRFGTDES